MWPAYFVAVRQGAGAVNVVFYVLVTMHVLCALAGFASTGFAGAYASRAGRALSGASSEGPDGMEELQRYFSAPPRAWWALWAVPLLGGAAVSVQPGGHGLAQLWVLGALAVWALALGLAGKVIVPGSRELAGYLAAQAHGAELGPGVPARAASAGKRASAAAAVCDCLFFCALALMIWQPS